ncbi:hypothetical protein F4811DRAFT_572530 [Daldinia bambusicola]|nr:hypothetical protein F4811DRAFT_572530 [Daldinia bambusicola]
MSKRKSTELEESQSDTPPLHQPHKRSKPDGTEEDAEMEDATSDSEQLNTSSASDWTVQCISTFDYWEKFKEIYPEDMLEILGIPWLQDEWLGPPFSTPDSNERTDVVFVVAHSTASQISWGNDLATASAKLAIEGTYRSLQAANIRAMEVFYEARVRSSSGGWERPRPEMGGDLEVSSAGERSWRVDGGMLTLRFTEANLVDGCEVSVTKHRVL